MSLAVQGTDRITYMYMYQHVQLKKNPNSFQLCIHAEYETQYEMKVY